MPADRDRRIWLRIARDMCLDALVGDKAKELLDRDEAEAFLTDKERRAMRVIAAGRA